MQIDYREESIFKYFPQMEIANLDVGDIVYKELCIERKAVEDFLSSIVDRRVFNQAINMRNNFKYPIILVEGDLKSIGENIYFSERKMSIEQVRGAIASLYIKYNVPVLFCSGRKSFVEIVNKLIEKYNEKADLLIYNPPVKKGFANPKLQILLQIDGIGPKKAKKILDHYGLFSNFDHMERPQGVSEKEIQRIQEVLK